MQPLDESSAWLAGRVGGEADLQALGPKGIDGVRGTSDRGAALVYRAIEVEHDALNTRERLRRSQARLPPRSHRHSKNDRCSCS